MDDSIDNLAKRVVAGLAEKKFKLVLAESCTCGRVAAALGLVPGVSQFLCGSFVVYRATSKIAWLEIDPAVIEKHSTESPECSLALANAALEKTPEADIAIAVTGDLGPGIDQERDGLIHIAGLNLPASHSIQSSLRLRKEIRADRQSEATEAVLEAMLGLLG